MKLYFAGNEKAVSTYLEKKLEFLESRLISYHYINYYNCYLRKKEQMNIYFAGEESTNFNLLRKDEKSKILGSFHYLSDKQKNELQNYFKRDQKLFLDSGAFSAWSRGVDIDIDKYISFIKDNTDILDIYASLDVIGDEKKSLHNLQYMESKGLNPLPCYHANESESLLRYYCENYDYFAIGGLVGFAKKKKELFEILDFCYSVISEYFPKKTHLFGMTNIEVLLKYPCYSSDSTSWISGSKTGSIYQFSPFEINKMYGYALTDIDSLKFPGILDSNLFDIDDKNNWQNILIYNINEYKKLELIITKIWEERGVVLN